MSARRRRRPSAREQLITEAVRHLSRTQQGRRLLVVAAVLALLALAWWWLWENHLRPRHPVGPTVRVATWNIRQFSDRPAVDVRAIAEIIRSSNFDVVAIQEVKKQGEAVDRLLNELGSPWRATALSPTTGNYERFVFLYHGDHVQPVGPAHFIAGPSVAVFDRMPFQGTFRAGNFDFTLISVHLSFTDTKRRRAEAEALAQYAEDLAESTGERDVIVLGDFNEQGRGNLHFFESLGWQSLNREPSNLSSTETYDTLLVQPAHTQEWSGEAGAVEFDETRYNNQDDPAADAVSDHRPVYADFVTNLPDDD